MIATFRVARLTLQTRKLWLVGIATLRDARYLLICPNVKNKKKKNEKIQKMRDQKKAKKEEKSLKSRRRRKILLNGRLLQARPSALLLSCVQPRVRSFVVDTRHCLDRQLLPHSAGLTSPAQNNTKAPCTPHRLLPRCSALCRPTDSQLLYRPGFIWPLLPDTLPTLNHTR